MQEDSWMMEDDSWVIQDDPRDQRGVSGMQEEEARE